MPSGIAGSVAGPVAGALLGGLTGGESSGGTQITKPWLPKKYEEEYDALLEKALKLSDTPFAPRDTMRVDYAYPTNAFEGLFQNRELGELQKRSDQKYFESLVKPQAQEPAAPQEDPQAMADLEARMAARQYFAGAGGTMANPASTRTAQSRLADMYGAGLFDDAGLADIGRFVQASGGAQNAAGYDRANRQDPALLEAFGRAQQAALAEAMKRKAMGV